MYTYLSGRPPTGGSFTTMICLTLPADSNLEFIKKQGGMSANFQIPRYPV